MVHDVYSCITSRISTINFSSLSSIICPSPLISLFRLGSMGKFGDSIRTSKHSTGKNEVLGYTRYRNLTVVLQWWHMQGTVTNSPKISVIGTDTKEKTNTLWFRLLPLTKNIFVVKMVGLITLKCLSVVHNLSNFAMYDAIQGNRQQIRFLFTTFGQTPNEEQKSGPSELKGCPNTSDKFPGASVQRLVVTVWLQKKWDSRCWSGEICVWKERSKSAKKRFFSRSGDTVFVPFQSCEGAPITYSNVTACLSQHLGETESTCRWQNLHWLPLISPSVFPSAVSPSGVVLLAVLGPRLLSLDRSYVPCLWSWLSNSAEIHKFTRKRRVTAQQSMIVMMNVMNMSVWSCSMP